MPSAEKTNVRRGCELIDRDSERDGLPLAFAAFRENRFTLAVFHKF